MITLSSKSFIIPKEKILEETEYGTLESVIIPIDPYELHGKPRAGRCLLIKNQEDFRIIAYLPNKWQVTLTSTGFLRAHNPQSPNPKIYEGNLWDAKTIDPWEEGWEAEPCLPWMTPYSINLKTSSFAGQPNKSLQSIPFILQPNNNILLLAYTQENTLTTTAIKPLPKTYKPTTHTLTCYQNQNQTTLRTHPKSIEWSNGDTLNH